MKTASKKKPVSAQPAQSHQLQSAGGDPDEPQEADAAAVSTTTGVKGGRETDSSGHDSKVSAIDGKPASPSVDLTDEQSEVVKRFRKMKSQPDCSELNLGSALLDIKRNQRLPMHGGNIDNCEQLLDLDRFEVRRLVDLAEPHRAEHGGGSPARSADLRPSGSNASKPPPASPSEAAAGDERSAAPAPIPAPEKMSARTKKLKATEVAEPQAGEAVQDRALPPVETTQPGPAEPALAPAGPVEQAAQADTAPPVAEPETMPAECLGQTPVQAMIQGDEMPAPDNAGRLIQLEAVIVRFMTATFAAGRAMREIQATKLYLKHFDTFEAYCEVRLGFNRSRGYQLINAANVMDTLSTLVDTDTSHLTERHCRVLAKLEAADQPTVWKKAAAAAPDGKVTLGSLKNVVAKLLPPTRTKVSGKAKPEARVDVEKEGGKSDNTQPAPQTGTALNSSQPDPAPDTSPALDGLTEFDLENEWPPLEESLDSLFRRCGPNKWPDLWNKLQGFFARHRELIPDENK